MLQVMKRRRFITTIASVSALPIGLAAQAPPQRPGMPANEEPTAALEIASLDSAADPLPEFFTVNQYAALTRVSDLLMPKIGTMPGALDAGVPAFLDFLIGESPEAEQIVYVTGLDALNYQATTRFGKTFAMISDSQAHELLAPLRQPWTPEPSTDPLTIFLQQAKSDVRTATTNSQQYAEASAAEGGGGRRMGGGGQYWTTVE